MHCLRDEMYVNTPLRRVQNEMKTIERFMGYCLALRERRKPSQMAVFHSLGIGALLIQGSAVSIGIVRQVVALTTSLTGALLCLWQPHLTGSVPHLPAFCVVLEVIAGQ